jgi:hypothetical protein
MGDVRRDAGGGPKSGHRVPRSHDPHRGGAWFPTLDAEVRSSRAGLEGDLISDDDVGIDDPDVVFQGGVTFRLAKRHVLRIDGFAFGVDGDRQTDRTFTFDGRTYPVATPVTSEADVAFAGLDYGFDVVHTGQAALGLNIGVRFVGAEASIDAPRVSRPPCRPWGWS